MLFSINWSAACHDRGPAFTGVTHNTVPIPVGRGGRFSVRASFSGHGKGGGVVRYTLSFSGTAPSAAKAVGMWSLTVAGAYQGGRKFRCSTSTVRWPGPSGRSHKPGKGGKLADLASGGSATAVMAGGDPFGFTTQTSSPGTRPATWETSGQTSGQTPQVLDLAGQVLYEKRACYSGAPTPTPLQDATITVRAANGTRAAGPLDATGHYRLQLSGTLPVSATVTLASARIKVGPETNITSPYEVPLGEVAIAQNPNSSSATPTPKLVPVSVISGDGPAGAANIFAVLDHTANVTATVSPVAIPQLSVQWRYGPDLTSWLGNRDPSSYDYSNHELLIGGSNDGSIRRDEFEEFPMLHEYGHFVLDTIAPVGPATGEHTFTGVYPNEPDLAWSEGFANFFYSAISGNPTPTLECKPAAFPPNMKRFGGTPSSGDAVDLSTAPASPAPSVPSEAQYNEIAIAGVLWNLSNYLGSNVPQQGLGTILRALHQFPAQSAREFRDALIESGVESTSDTHNAIDRIFANQAIAWGFTVYLDVDRTGCGFRDGCGVTLSISGPYGCNQDYNVRTPYTLTGAPFQWDGSGAPGPLSYTWQSDCLMDSVSPWGGILFPYAPGNTHAPFVVYATASCDGAACPTSLPSGLAVAQFGLWGDYSIPALGNNEIDPSSFFETLPNADKAPASGIPYDAFQLPVGVPVKFAEFSADGRCTVFLPARVDCPH